MKSNLLETLRGSPQPLVTDLLLLADVQPSKRSVLLRPLVDLLELDPSEVDRLWSTLSDSSLARLALPDFVVGAMRWPYLSEDDCLDAVLAISVDYLLDLFTSTEGFDAFIDAVIELIASEIGHDVRFLSSHPEVASVSIRTVAGATSRVFPILCTGTYRNPRRTLGPV